MKIVGSIRNGLCLILACFWLLLILAAGEVPAVAAPITSCRDCHGMPPIDVPYRNITSGGFRGSHRAHQPSIAAAGDCAPCHPGSAGYSFGHKDGIIQVSAAINNSPLAATYSKGTFFNQTSLPVLGTCTNVNCHFEARSPTWGNPPLSSINDCNVCHGSPPADGNHPVAGQKHAVYYGTTSASCGKCHVDHTAEVNPFAHATSVGRRGLDVRFTTPPNSGGSYSGNLSYPAYLPSQNPPRNGTCTSIYCHSPGTGVFAPPNKPAVWGGSLGTACTGCHKGDAVSNDPMATGTHGLHVAYYYTDPYGTVFYDGYRYDCSACHSVTVIDSRTIRTTTNHVDGQVSVAFKNGSTAFNGRYNGLATPMTKTPGSAYGSCQNIYCHSNVQPNGGVGGPTAFSTPLWGGTHDVCTGCHREGAHMGTAADGTSGEIVTGSHTRHLAYAFTTASDAVKCTICHKWNTAAPFDPNCNASCHEAMFSKHANGRIDIIFEPFFGTANYNGSTLPGNGYRSCSNTYCHSDGTAVATGVIPANTAAVWGTPGPLGCTSCHGNPPAYVSGSPKANSHGQHAAYSCSICHNSVTTTGTAISSTFNHVNKAYDVVPAGTVTFTYGFATTGGTCTNISCHGNNSATWGATTPCQACHLGSSDVIDYTYGNGTVALVKGVGEWDTTGHGRASGTYSSGNGAAVFTVTNACLYCHDSTVNHNVAANPLRLRNFNDPAWGKNGVCQICHAAGSAGVMVDGVTRNGSTKVGSTHFGAKHTTVANGGQFCWDCHDGHGDANVYMVHGAVAAVSTATTGVPTTTVTTVFTAFATGTDYARSSAPFNGICNVCHGSSATPAAHYTAASGDGHNLGSRCSICHSHSGSTISNAFSANAGHAVPYYGHNSPAPAIADCGSCHANVSPTAPYPAGTPPNYTAPDCRVCHGQKSAYGVSNCSSCHGNPPTGTIYPDSAGTHAKHNALAGVTGACGSCHNGAGSGSGTKHGKGNRNANPAMVDVAFLAAYSAKGATASYTAATRQCLNVSCHGGQMTPDWQTTGSIVVNTACDLCHAYGTSQYNSYNSGQHNRHVNTLNKPCTSCHDTSPTKLGASHFVGLATPAFTNPAGTLFTAIGYNGTSCNPSAGGLTGCHGSENW